MNKYFKLDEDEEVFVTDSNFSDEAIAYMEKEGIENCDDFLDEFEKFNVRVEVCDPLVDECFNIINNYVEIGMYVKNIYYFETAVEVMIELLQSAPDFYDVAEKASWADDGSNYEQNYVYARTIILDGIMKTFSIGKDSPQDVLNVYHQVAVLNYKKIKKITIDEIEFRDINKAQEHINKQILLHSDSFYENDTAQLEIIVLLSDEYETFDLTLNITDAFKYTTYWKDSLAEILCSIDDFFGREFPIIGKAPESYEINLCDYKKEDRGVIDLRFLHEDIYLDMNRHIVKHKENREDITLALISFAFSTLKESYRCQIKGNSTIEDRYLMLKFFALDNTSYSLREKYRFNEYKVHDEYQRGLHDFEFMLKDFKG